MSLGAAAADPEVQQSRNYFKEERNTIMAGDLAEVNREQMI